ncbi:MAG: calcium/sodium antiporter [Maricaulaceae bacterium]|jgi:cation:H+ antiporter
MTIALLAVALVAGFIVLIVAGDILVRGSAALAQRAGVPPLIVGLTIVAFGTSAPELFVSIQAVLSDAPKLAIGNIVGSNIANILLVLSIPAFFAAVPTDSSGAGRNTVIMIIASFALIICSVDGRLTFFDGAALFVGIIIYLVFQGVRARAHRSAPDVQELTDLEGIGLPASWTKIGAFVGVGLIGLPIGGWLIVKGGVGIADALSVPREFIGLTVVAFGTSLPELATSVVAAVRRHSEVAIGNVVGSNVFNVFAVGGAAAMTGPIPVPVTFSIWDYPVMMIASFALLGLVLLRRRIGWATGAVFFLAYLGYIFGLAWLEDII